MPSHELTINIPKAGFAQHQLQTQRGDKLTTWWPKEWQSIVYNKKIKKKVKGQWLCEGHVILPLKILLPCNFQPQAWTDHRHKAPKLYVLSLSRPVDYCGNKANIYCVRSTSTAEYSSEIKHNTKGFTLWGPTGPGLSRYIFPYKRLPRWSSLPLAGVVWSAQTENCRVWGSNRAGPPNPSWCTTFPSLREMR